MLAIQGFGDMKEQARDTMIRDKFIAGQGQCALRRQLDGFAQRTPIGEIVDSCRVWESHSDSNRIPTVNYDSEVGSQSSDSRTWERRKVVMDMERREPEAGYRKNDSGLGTVVDQRCQLMGEEARERDRPPTGGSACIPGGNDGHEVNQHPDVGAVLLQKLKTGWPHWNNKQYRGKNRNQKLMESLGNEQGSERVGQPLGPPEIKAPLTLVGVPAEISNGDHIGMNGGTIVRVISGRPIVRNFHHWERRRRPERPKDRPVPVTPKWTSDRWATRHRSSEIWTGRCGRLKTLDRSLAKTGSSKIETPWDSIKCKIATIGTACPTKIGKPVAMADVAEPGGPAGTGADGPVVAGTLFPAVADRTGASGPRRPERDSDQILMWLKPAGRPGPVNRS